jgi:hypothetical protein
MPIDVFIRFRCEGKLDDGTYDTVEAIIQRCVANAVEELTGSLPTSYGQELSGLEVVSMGATSTSETRIDVYTA